jgi:hypothetical protein
VRLRLFFLTQDHPLPRKKERKKYQGVSQVGHRLYFAVPLFFLYRNTSSCAKMKEKKTEKEEGI